MPNKIIFNKGRRCGRSTAREIMAMAREKAEYFKNWEDAMNQAADKVAQQMSYFIDDVIYKDICSDIYTKLAQRKRAILLLMER